MPSLIIDSRPLQANPIGAQPIEAHPLGEDVPVSPFQVSAGPVNLTDLCSISVYDDVFSVDWGDGTPIDYASGTPTIASQVPTGNIIIRSDGAPTRITFTTNTYNDINIVNGETLTSMLNMCLNLTALVTYNMGIIPNVTNLANAWEGCSGLTSFPFFTMPIGITNLNRTWFDNQSLTSFPLIDTSNITSMFATWQSSGGLTSFPAIDTSSVTKFQFTWAECSSILVQNLYDMANGDDFQACFRGNEQLTSLPAINTIKGLNFNNMFRACTNLVCLSSLDTRLSTTSSNLFLGANALVAPDGTEQSQLATIPGILYTNPGACP